MENTSEKPVYKQNQYYLFDLETIYKSYTNLFTAALKIYQEFLFYLCFDQMIASSIIKEVKNRRKQF